MFSTAETSPPSSFPALQEVRILSVSGSSEPPGQKDQDWFHNSLGEKNTLELSQAQLGLPPNLPTQTSTV